LLAPAQPPSCLITPFRLFSTAYSLYSLLPSIFGGRLLRTEPEDVPCCGDELRILCRVQHEGTHSQDSVVVEVFWSI